MMFGQAIVFMISWRRKMNKPMSRSVFRGICVGAIAAGVALFHASEGAFIFIVTDTVFFDFALPESVAATVVVAGLVLWGIVGLLFTDRVYPTKGDEKI